MKIWEIFARLTAQHAKVLFGVMTRLFIRIFWPYFSKLLSKGHLWGDFWLLKAIIWARPSNLRH